MNDQIVKRIRETRLERQFTQKDLANHLGKTSAAISDLERGKVQVTARDLYKIANFLNKPIEYFFGEEFGEKEIQDIIAIMRKESPEDRANTIAIISMIVQMQQVGQKIVSDPEIKPTNEEILQFLTAFIPFSEMLNKQTNQLNELKDKFLEDLKLQGIELTELGL